MSSPEEAARENIERFDSLKVQSSSDNWLEPLVGANIVSADTLQRLRRECDELTAIFVTILKRSKRQ